MITGRRRDPLDAIAREIAKRGGVAHARACDLTNVEDCRALGESALDHLGHVDVLVNNAGLLVRGKLLAGYSIDEWNATMDTNVRSAFILSKTVLPAMVERKNGHIVNISSVSGVRHYVGEAVYGISKHALNALTNFIAEEYGPDGIKATAICPGLTLTEMGLSLHPSRHDRLLAPADIADAVIWAINQRSAVKIASPLILEPASDPWDGHWTPIDSPV
jgi:NADP-dependent 3-hydroxy acid dehydrogenase YdfG